MSLLVMMLEKVKPSMRGELSRWLVEVKSGVYVGNVSALVRDRLWEKCSSSVVEQTVFQAWPTNNEQGYCMRIAGFPRRLITDWEGMQLITELKEDLSEVQKKRINQ